ncbi:hypothetical protein [Salipiger mucosus]|uniref:Uncharacterized protein n=1 Tax=Salipiger mucosus DSM 16094 TaxID=1123237 RepID=S9QID2_9RHOB|nr:hypothetical protein [Salipiger mucosus]EPX79562.1 hypothetical protein Salmuc_05502 [Salipiger mucosus DSM 16094]
MKLKNLVATAALINIVASGVAFAGGPVVVESEAEPEVSEDDPFALAGPSAGMAPGLAIAGGAVLAAAALAASSDSSSSSSSSSSSAAD